MGKNSEDLRNKPLTIYLNVEEYELIRRLAFERNMSRPEYIRLCVFAENVFGGEKND